MIMVVVGIRQAVKNKHFDEMNHITEGVLYNTTVSDFTSAMDEQIGLIYRAQTTPINFIASQYAVFGDDTQRITAIRSSVELLSQRARFTLKFQDVEDEDDMFEYVRSNEYQRDNDFDALLFAIQVPPPGFYNYTIYMSANFNEQIPNTLFDSITAKPDLRNFNKYAYNGFATLQYLLAQTELSLAGEDAEIQLFMTSGKTKEFTRDDFMDQIGPNLALFILLIFIAPQYRLVGFLTEEKASRAREGMKIMGLNDAPYWISWFIYYFFVCLTISIVVSAIMTLFLFPNSSWFFLFLFIYLYGMSLFSFSLLISSFLQRPKIACILATLIHFLTYFMVVPVMDNSVSMVVKGIFSFIPNIGMALAINTVTGLESNGNGLNGASLSEELGNYKVGIAFITWSIMFFVQGLLALYLDNVLPKEFGKRQPLLFFLTKDYWFGAASVENDENKRLLDDGDEDVELNGGSRDFEAVPPNIRQLEKEGDCLKVRKLRKVYPNGKEAVKDVSLTMYKNQIFALLGHNGAGKTTTLSILTGLYAATSGKASVFKLDMFRNVNDVRKILGVCPQFDILFDLLTPVEHLQLYCMFKGVPADKIQEEVTKTLKDVDLESKKTAYAKSLSGGQKRKLSVGIAMIGGSKLVLLDEPTSGMDLTARRRIWDMLKNNKQNKILILTTHFMDEADILGDRIAIMAGGTIKCCGGSLFLKKRFGVGYNLIISKENKDPNGRIDDFIKERIPAAIKLGEVSAEVTYQIPQTESDKFESFFTDLDQSLRDLKIKSYGVGVTTLEEVFLRVGREDEEESENGGAQSIATMKKQIEEEKENTGGSVHSLNHSGDKLVEDYSIAEESEQNVFWLHFWALSVKRFLVSFRQLRSSLLEILIPIILIIVGLALANVEFFTDPDPFVFSMSKFPKPNNIYRSQMDPITTSAGVDTYFEYFGNNEQWNLNQTESLDRTQLNTTLPEFEDKIFNLFEGYDSNVDNLGNHIIYDIDETQDTKLYQVIGFANAYARDGAALQMQSMLNAALKVASPNKKIEFETRVYPFPLTATATAGAKAGSGSIVAFLFGIALAMIPAGVASSIVGERESNVKHQQFISGASMISYWISNYVVDFLRSLLPIFVAIIFVFIFNLDLPYVWILFLLFAVSIHPFTYATSFLFKKEGVASTLTIMIHIFGGGFLAIAMLVLQSFPSTSDFGNIARWFPKIIPSYCVISGILQISARTIFARAKGQAEPKAPLSFDVAGGDIMFLAINFFLWWAVLILFENGWLNFSCRRRGGDFDATRRTENIKIDNDVQAEENRCDEVSPSECSVLVQRLRKVYSGDGGRPFLAVRNISFGLEYGECFALLGVNGAGKTTTFKSMTGDVKPSDGKLYIDGLDLSRSDQFSRARKLIGYCPQENAIFEGMTVKEHLVFYSRIKGILKHKRAEIIEKIMEEMDLKEFQNVRCEELSGGNKRKLSVAMAMIGNPPIVFLDEPSTGMDPRAKRFMWTIISRISTLRKKSTVILTTHSMEEAEALCTKMGIMVNGRFKCYGSGQEIKDKFGTGYEVEIKVTWPTESEANELAEKHRLNPDERVTEQSIEQTLRQVKMEHLTDVSKYDEILADIEKEKSISVQSLLQWALLEDTGLYIKKQLERNTSECWILEHYNNFYKFRIERGEKSLGFFFGFMESLKSEINFEEYAVSQTTLEQIFNSFALEQDMDGEGGGKKVRRSTVRKEKEL